MNTDDGYGSFRRDTVYVAIDEVVEHDISDTQNFGIRETLDERNELLMIQILLPKGETLMITAVLFLR